jgi:hypothetical protein
MSSRTRFGLLCLHVAAIALGIWLGIQVFDAIAY